MPSAAAGSGYFAGGEGPLQNPASAQSGGNFAGGYQNGMMLDAQGAANGASNLPTFANGMSGTVNADGTINYGSAGQSNILAPGQTGMPADNSAAFNPDGSVTLPELTVTAPGAENGMALIDSTGTANSFNYSSLDQYTLSEEATNYFENEYGNDGGYDPGYTDYGGGSFGGSYGPVVLDLNGDGINITPKTSSHSFFDMAGDGYQHHTAWAGAGDGVLVFDVDGDGKTTQQNEVVFTDWDPTATSDMQALADVFDTNHDGKLDAGDAQFASFKIRVSNADGTKTLETLAQAGVSSINLTVDKTKKVFTDGSSIDGESTFTRTDGTTGTAATVTFAYDAAPSVVRATRTTNADGSSTIDEKSLNTDGSLANEIISTTSADGLSETIQFDNNGDGVIDDVQTSATVANADGSRTNTLSNATTTGILLNRITTTTSADGKSVTILRDANGNGATDQREVDLTNADGSKSVTVTNLNPDGSTANSVAHLVSADGQTGTTQTDFNGDGVYDLTTVDQTVTNADASRTQTVSETNADGSLRDRSIQTTSADAASQSVKTDVNGDGVYDLTRISAIVRNADGSTTTTQTDQNADGSTRDTLTTRISADGLTTTTTKDANGDGVVDLTHTDSTTINSDGSRTETLSDTNVAGTLLDRTVIVKGADGVTRTTTLDTDGNGTNDSVDQVTTSAGVVTDTVSNYEPDGTTLDNRTTTTTSADGLTRTVQTDANGDGVIDRTTTVQTVKNGDGSATVTTSDRSNSNLLLDQAVVTTSADGLTTTTNSDLNGDGTFEFTSVAATVANADGSRTTTSSTTSTNGTLQSKVVTTVSADHNTTTITSDSNGDGATDTAETIAKQADGSSVDTVKHYASNGTLISTETRTTSANGLSVTTQTDVDGDGTVDTTTSDVTVLNRDGSRTDTVTTSGQNGVLRGTSVTTTSATGLSTTVQSDVDGNGSTDATNTSTTVLNNDGSRTTTTTQSAGGTTLRSVATTISATGLSTFVVSDLDGDGAKDLSSSDGTTLNADGTTTETVSRTSGNGAVIDQTVTTTSADRKTVTIAKNIDGVGAADNTETIATQTDGSVTDTDVAVDAAGTLLQKIVKTKSSNGLSSTQTLDANGDGTIDETQSDAIVFNADGSRTETYTDNNTSANIQPGSYGDTSTVVTQTSGNGLSKTITVTGYNEGIDISHTTTDNIVIGADGSRTETRTVSSQSGGTPYTVSNEVITDAAHGISHTVQLDEYGTGTFNITDATVLNADGSKTETYTENDQSGALAEKDITTTSANGQKITVQSDTDGDGVVDQIKTTNFNADGSRTDVISTQIGLSSLFSQTTETTSADGRSKTTTYDYDGDGVIDATQTQISAVNADGSTTQTRSDLNSNGTLHDKIVTNTSANGYNITGTIDLNGDGTTDENFSNTVVLNADGTTTTTAQTTYSDGTLKSRTVTTTSANGLVVTVNEDLNGDGVTDVSEVDSTASSGVKTSTISHFNASGVLLARDVSVISADGRQQSVSRDFNGDGTQDVLEVEDRVADGNGSYDVAAEDTNAALYEGNHTIDENGVERINVLAGANSNPYTRIETVAQENRNLGILGRFYDVLLDRDPTSAENQGYFQYQNFSDLVSAITTSSEFTQKYGTMTSAELIEQLYQNAYGRSAKVGELNSWLSQLQTGAATVTDLVGTLSESAEHLTDGNTHAITNNSQNVSGTFTIDHTTDRAVAENIADRLYLTSLNRHAEPAAASANGQIILNGTATEAQIAASLISSAEFNADYGRLSDAQFVTQMFQNGLGRAPTSTELSSWSQMLTAGTLSRADLVVGIADSPDHYAASGSPTASASAVSTSQYSKSDSMYDTGVNRMVQAMSQMSPQSTSSWSATMPDSQVSQEHTLAASH